MDVVRATFRCSCVVTKWMRRGAGLMELLAAWDASGAEPFGYARLAQMVRHNRRHCSIGRARVVGSGKPMAALNPTIEAVTERIRARSAKRRQRYLDLIDAYDATKPARARGWLSKPSAHRRPVAPRSTRFSCLAAGGRRSAS